MGSNDLDRPLEAADRAARSEALFASLLPRDAPPDRRAVTAAIQWAVRAYDGVGGCAAEMAAAYGKDPDVAAARMRWARHVVMAVFPEEV
jgi:hypothetical protein